MGCRCEKSARLGTGVLGYVKVLDLVQDSEPVGQVGEVSFLFLTTQTNRGNFQLRQVNGLLGSGEKGQQAGPQISQLSVISPISARPPKQMQGHRIKQEADWAHQFSIHLQSLAANGLLSWLASDIKCGGGPLPTSIHHVCLYACLPRAALWYWVLVATPSSLLTTQCQTTARLSANLEPPALPCPVESSRVIQRVSLFGVFCRFFVLFCFLFSSF